MDNLFYFTGIVFMAEALRSAFAANKEVDSYKADVSFPDKNISIDELKNLKASLMSNVKGKIFPAILGALMITWNIVGILYTQEWKLFLASIVITLVSSVIVAYIKKFRTVPIIIVSNILYLLVISLILYTHFA